MWSIGNRADPHVPLADIGTMQDIVDGETSPRSVQLRVLAPGRSQPD